ncbi:MAG: hypothetical protein JWR50_826 [Mucilaginibacter sp.]|nr:hypothetical protein [Mucilaginibacter sp.]
MSNQDQYLKLWQQKRGELQVSDDVQADWLGMQNVLDELLPVNNAPGGTNLSTKLTHFAKFKLLYVLAALLATGTLIYVVIHNRKTVKNNKPDKIEIRKHSVSSNRPDSIFNTDSSVNSNKMQDSAAINATTKDSSALNTAGGKNVGDNPGSKAANTNAGSKENSVTNKNTIKRLGNNIANANPRSTEHTANNKFAKSNRADINHSRVLSEAGSLRNGTGTVNNASSHLLRRGNPNNRVTGFNHPGSTHSGSLVRRNRYYSGTRNRSDIEKDNTGLIENRLHTDQVLLSSPVPPSFNRDNNALINKPSSAIANKKLSKTRNTPINKNTKSAKNKTQTSPQLDWGILAGVNTQGSFTPKNQNKNFYGSLPVDVYGGLFATYNVNDKWAINLQTRLLTPHKVSGSYTHANESKIDSNQNLRITDSRKIYTADIPVNVAYKITENINLKAGVVFSLPIKQVNGASAFTTSGARKDSTSYYNNVTAAINSTNFEKKVHLSLSGGIGFNYKRLLFDANYAYGLQTQKISSSLGSYTSNTSGVQLTIGFKLSKSKP